MVAALYRRYRPEAFAEMIGQSQVTEPLMTALRTGRIGHAYLFSGPRGCGKTTSARILARCLNCAEGPTDTPCGVCPSCVELSRGGGGSLDVVEIDAASHGGVDDARDLRERAAFAPARDRFKIFIIDEAHMVTAAGFNALLKIVEEPPPHVKFVFATTEPDKVIGTIRSRTHHYPFRLIAPGTLIDYVQSLCDSEGVRVEPGVLPLVVRAGGGSVRDTLSILDQLIAGTEGDSVSAERAAGLLGFTHTELLDDVVGAFGARDAADAFAATDRVVQTGQDPRRFVEDLLERLRDLIVVGATTVDGAAAVFRGVPQDQLSRMFEQAQSFAPGELSRVADIVSAALDRMAGATAPRMQLELMIARVLVEIPGAHAATDVSRTQGAQGQGSQAQAPHTQGSVQGSARPTAGAQAAPGGARQQPDQRSAPAQQQAPGQQAPASPQTPERQQSAPNAAQTAASIREFLREDVSGGGSGPRGGAQGPAGQAQAPAGQAQAPAEQAQQASGAPEPQSAPTQQDERPSAQSQPAVPEQPAAPEQPDAGQQLSDAKRPQGGAPHPNEGAAKFGRPISDVLSSAQIASIGTDAPRAAAPAPAASEQQTAPAAAAPAASAPAGPGAGTPTGTGAQTPVPTAAESPSDDESSDAADAQPGFEDLLELWPDLLEEILEQDRDAWNAVRPVQPLSLDGDILAVGIASGSDLAAFKAAGAGPLREAILSAVGVSVRYVPKRMPAEGQQPTGTPQQGGQPGAPGAAPDAEEPHQSGLTAPSSPGQSPVRPGSDTSARESKPRSAPAPTPADDPMERAKARLSGLGPALAAPAWADLPADPGAAGKATAGPTSAPERPASVDSASVGSASANPASANPVPGSPAAENAVSETPAAETPADENPTDENPAAPAEGAESAAPAASGAAEDESAIPGAEASASADPDATGRASAVPDPETPDSVSPRAGGPAPYADDPYAGDPYAGEPSDDGYGDDAYGGGDPYAAPSGPGGSPRASGTPARSASAAPAQAAPVQPAPAQPAPAEPAQPSAGAAARPVSEPPASGASASAPEPAAEKDPARSAPKFTRYGEAVVREVLGARFVEERPLPPRLEA